MKETMKPTQLDDLIRGEIAAVKSYDTALEKVSDVQGKSELLSIRQDHVKAVETLKKYADFEVKAEAKDGGIWAEFTKAFTGGASIFGNTAALKALKIGEEHGIQEYKEALKDDTIQAELKQIIQTELLPNQQKHIATIDQLTH